MEKSQFMGNIRITPIKLKAAQTQNVTKGILKYDFRKMGSKFFMTPSCCYRDCSTVVWKHECMCGRKRTDPESLVIRSQLIDSHLIPPFNGLHAYYRAE
jgi:hypothetical protein